MSYRPIRRTIPVVDSNNNSEFISKLWQMQKNIKILFYDINFNISFFSSFNLHISSTLSTDYNRAATHYQTPPAPQLSNRSTQAV